MAEARTLTPTAEDRRIAALAALAVTIHLAEAALPSPLPGFKPGLANVITVAALYCWGWSTAAWVTALRVLVGGLLLGTFLSPTFALSAGGAIASLAALAVAVRLPATGPLGASILAAMAHTTGQFLAAWWLFIPHPDLPLLLPPLLTLAVIAGTVSGTIATVVVNGLRRE
jgi:heptaprenyl diphosphate synthase